MRPLLTASLTLLLLPAAAHAGGWASAGVLNPPASVAPGAWTAQIEILQHGRTPLTGVKPAVVLRSAQRETRFAAKPVPGRPGVYAADVVFPSAGTYRYEIDDGFTNAVPHTFPPIEVRAAAPAAAASASGGFPYLTVAGGVAALALALALALAALMLGRRRRGPLPA